MAYVIRKVMPRELVMRKIKKLIQSCQIASIDKETVLSAVTSCASSSVIKNEWRSRREGNVPLPLGYDEATGTQLGNSDFLVNAVNYLAGKGEWVGLRTPGVQLRLLDKAEVTARLLRWQALNVLLPLAVLLAGSLLFAWRRKARCRKWC